MNEPRTATLTYYVATTLDGFIADPDDSLAWLLKQPHDEGGPLNYADFIDGVGAIAMGSTTYEWILEHNVGPGAPWPYDVPCWVLTTRDPALAPGGDIRFSSGDVRLVHEEMTRAANGKNLWVMGGGELAGQFADAGLLDEIITYVAPVTLGQGRRLLPRRLDLELLEVHRNDAFACMRYRVTGPLADDSSTGAPGDTRR